ncbi:MAG: phosphatidate cytidylyltransferase [Hyphomicrobiales bacterium]|nr:phosphatidate cytidylyltransferase [Hyphomicrobiales bacterium]
MSTGKANGSELWLKSALAKLQDLKIRIISGVVMASLALVCLWAGGWLFSFCWLFLSAMVAFEWQTMVTPQASTTRNIVALVMLLAMASAMNLAGAGAALECLLAGVVAIAALAPAGQRLWAGGGALYAGTLLLAVMDLRFSLSPFGFLALFWLFGVVWMTDIMAYFGGRLIGGAKLWPQVSPSKTWAGTLSGLISGTLAGAGIVWLAGMPVSWPLVLLLGVAASLVAQGGDLLESAMKRHFGVKDSSPFIPGHGGFMDRLDGFIAASIFVALFGFLRLDAPMAAAGLFQW